MYALSIFTVSVTVVTYGSCVVDTILSIHKGWFFFFLNF